jgi:hypothetical protein
LNSLAWLLLATTAAAAVLNMLTSFLFQAPWLDLQFYAKEKHVVMLCSVVLVKCVL